MQTEIHTHTHRKKPHGATSFIHNYIGILFMSIRSATGGRHSRVVSLRVSGTQAGSATRTAPLGLVFITFIFSLMRIF